MIRGADRVVSNQLSTSVLYAAAEGVETQIVGDHVVFPGVGTAPARKSRELWPEFHEPASVEQRREIALEELGSSAVREPDELRSLLGWSGRRVGPAAYYWLGAPARKAAAVLGIAKRPEGAAEVWVSDASPLSFLRHPLSHLPGRLPKMPTDFSMLPEPLEPNGN
jgi:hypothetical protein